MLWDVVDHYPELRVAITDTSAQILEVEGDVVHRFPIGLPIRVEEATAPEHNLPYTVAGAGLVGSNTQITVHESQTVPDGTDGVVVQGEGRNWTETDPPSESPNFPPSRGFNAVVIDTQGYTMGRRPNNLGALPGDSEGPPPLPGGTYFVEPEPDWASRLVRRYVNELLHDQVIEGTRVVTKAFVKIPDREVFWAYTKFRANPNDPTVFSHIARFMDQILSTATWTPATWPALGEGGIPNQDRIAGFTVTDEPELVRRFVKPSEGLPVSTAAPVIAGVTSTRMTRLESTRFQVVAANGPFYRAEWDFGDGMSPRLSTALEPEVEVVGDAETDYSLTVRVWNAWGVSSVFRTRYQVFEAEESQLQLTGIAADLQLRGKNKTMALVPTAAGTNMLGGVLGGHQQIVQLIPLLLGTEELGGTSAAWTLEANGLTELADATLSDGTRLGVQLASVGSQAFPIKARGWVRIPDGLSGANLLGFEADVTFEPIPPDPTWVEPGFLHRLIGVLDSIQRATRPNEPPKPIFITHSAAVVRQKFRGEVRKAFVAGEKEGEACQLGPESGCLEIQHEIGAGGVDFLDRAGQRVTDTYIAPKDWRIRALNWTATDPGIAAGIHGFDSYRLTVSATVRNELVEAVIAREQPPAELVEIRKGQLTAGHQATDPIEPFVHFELMRRGQVQVSDSKFPSLKFYVNRRDPDPADAILMTALNLEDRRLPDGTVLRAPIFPRLPVLFWCQAWGQPYRNGELGVANPDGSVDPDAPAVEAIDFRYLRKPAVQGDGRSDEARNQAWFAIASGSEGIGIFAQIYVSDSILRDVWSPIAWEIRHYQDLKWNSTNLTAASSVGGEPVLAFTVSPGGPSFPLELEEFDGFERHHPLWMPPRAVILRRKEPQSYVDHSGVLTPSTVEFEGGELYMLLFNRSPVEVTFRTDFGDGTALQAQTGGDNAGKKWIEHKYRQPVEGATEIAGKGIKHFVVPGRSVQIFHFREPLP